MLVRNKVLLRLLAKQARGFLSRVGVDRGGIPARRSCPARAPSSFPSQPNSRSRASLASRCILPIPHLQLFVGQHTQPQVLPSPVAEESRHRRNSRTERLRVTWPCFFFSELSFCHSRLPRGLQAFPRCSGNSARCHRNRI